MHSIWTKYFMHSICQFSGQVWVDVPYLMMKFLSSLSPCIYVDMKNKNNEVFLSVVQLVTPANPYPFGGEKEDMGGIIFSEARELHL